MRRDSVQGFSLDVPNDWTFEDGELDTELQPDGVDAFVHVSLRAHSDPTGAAASEEEAVELLWSVVRYLSRSTERPPMQAWSVGESIYAWSEFDWVEDGVRVKCYAAGIRDWFDCYLVMTWIGEPDLVSYRRQSRTIFGSIARTSADTGNEMLRTSVDVFEVDWWIDPTGILAICLDPDAGYADLPAIIEVASASDVAAALRQVGVPSDEAESLAPALWERRWRPGGSG